MAHELMEDGYARWGDLGESTRHAAHYSRRENGDQQKQDVLEHLASLESWDLCNEAKVEKCRATRDLRSCGRPVKHLLRSCGHACLCVECSQRCDICPICRTPITRTEPVLRLRLYDECVEAGLLPSVQDDEFREREKEGPYWTLDAWRLCSFFDVAVENNLASLVCHYVTDVCMDEGAVSSDPVISMLLDGAVVKEWCKRTLVGTVRNLRDIYNSKLSLSKADVLDKHGRKLQGLSYVLETLEAPLNVLSASLVELQQLLEGVRMVMQHLEVMTWCIRQRFLENIQCCYSSFSHWKTAFQERKRAANDRAWPDYLAGSGRLGSRPQATLFIEDAMVNIGLGKEDDEMSNEFLELGLLRHGSISPSPSKHAAEIYYPPESTRAAVDLLFLEGTSDLFFAKKAILLYYLFDRHWTLPESVWRHIMEDYVVTFSIPRQSMLESFIFYILDNNSDSALKEACRLLPEIVGPNLHPKIARVLLERGRVDTALSILQSSGPFRLLEGGSILAPLSEAVTAVRVWAECGPLTEAYLYQQTHCKVVKAEQMKLQAGRACGAEDAAVRSRDWLREMDVLVGELCWFCIRRNCIDKMLELPWQAEEEKTIVKCLFEQAVQDRSSAAGSLLVVFYLQRCRFMEAYAMHQKLFNLEQQFITDSPDKEKVAKLQRACEQRTKLIEKSLELLPEVERNQILSDDTSVDEVLAGTSSMITSEEPQSRQLPEELRVIKEPLPPAVPSNLLINKKQVSVADDMSLPSPSGWGSFRQPSILHGRPFKSTPTSSPLFTPMDSPLLNGLSRATVPGDFGASPGLSPLLGKRLRYEADLTAYRQTEDQVLSSAAADFQGQQQAASAKKDRSQAMVATW